MSHPNLVKARSIAKTIVPWMVGAGTFKITHQIIDNNTDSDDEKRIDRATMFVGSATLAAMVGEHAKTYIDPRIDKFFDVLDRIEFKTADKSS